MLQDMIEAVAGKKYASADAKAAVHEGFTQMQQRVAPVLNKLNAADRISLAQLTLFPTKFSLAAAAAVMGMPEDRAQQQLLRLSSRALVFSGAESSGRLQQQYELHLLIRNTAAAGFQQRAALLSAQQRYVHHYISMLQTADYYYAAHVGSSCSFAQLAAERKSFFRIFQFLSQQQTPPGVDKVSMNIIKQLCSLGQPALHAIMDLGLDLGFDDTVVEKALRNLLQWCHHPSLAKQLKSSAINAKEQLGFYLAARWQRPKEARQLLKAVLEARQAHAGVNSFSLAMPLVGMVQAESAISCSGSSFWHQALAELRAHACLVEALAVLKQTRGVQDPYTIHCLRLAATLVTKDDLGAKWAAYRHLVYFSRLCLGPRHAMTLDIMSSLTDNLAEFALDDDEADEAVHLAKEGLAAVADTGDNGSIAAASVTLAEALLRTHEYAYEQEGVLKMLQAAGLQDREYGPTSGESLDLRLHNLVPALIQTQRYEHVIEVLVQDGPMWDRLNTHGVASIVRVECSMWLADAYCGKGDLAAAEDHLRTLLTRVSSSKMMARFGSEGKADCAMRLACVLACQGRWGALVS